MRILKQITFIFFTVAILSLSAFAQRQDPKPRPTPPPKERPPVVRPGEQKPPRDTPRDRDRRPQRPDEMAFVIHIDRTREEIT